MYIQIYSHTHTHIYIYMPIFWLYLVVHEIDHEVQPKDWLHPADSVRITEQEDEHAIHIFTDGSKSEHRVGSGIAIFIQSNLVHQLRYTLQ